MDNITYFISQMPDYLADIFNRVDRQAIDKITEIRIRKNKPLIIYICKQPYFLMINGNLTATLVNNCVAIDEDALNYIADRLCNHSYHTNMPNMINGYITTKNGCRVGISANAIYKDGQLSCVRDITSLNVRIAREHKNCSLKILNELYVNDTPSIIVAGGVMSGKTTFLRDATHLLSSGFAGKYRKVAVIDERYEISSGFDIGINTDALTGFTKSKGIEIVTRTLSPDIIVCDEIGCKQELEEIKYGFSTGVKFMASVHINNNNIFSNRLLQGLMSTGEFDYLLILKNFTDEFEIIDLRLEDFENNRNDNDYPFFIFPWIDDCD